MQERRRFVRMPEEATISYKILPDPKIEMFFTKDISQGGIRFGGEGWVIDPDGKVLGVTSEAEPFLTVDIELEDAVRAKGTYPRDVFM